MSPGSLTAWFLANAGDPESDIAPHFGTFEKLVIDHQARFVIELGVRKGASTSAWLYFTRNLAGHVWSVDIDVTPVPARRGWTFIHGNDLDVDVANQLPPVCDLLFIDTDHAYEHTLHELEMYGPRVRGGGVIVLHDTQNEHPEDHGEAIGYQEPFPVRRAMALWADLHGYAWTEDPASWGLGVIYVD